MTNELKAAEQLLRAAGVGTARLDALVLMEDVTGKDRAWLLAHPEFKISKDKYAKLQNLLKKRARHMPLAHVRGKTEFYGRTFLITSSVLEPRPESETMIDALKELVKNDVIRSKKGRKLAVADVGTGSGALGITVKLELPDAHVDLIDIDKKALEVAKSNVDKFTLNISLIESDLLSNCSVNYDVILCNLPYVPDGFKINLAATHEPSIAIFGGVDGLDIYRQLFKQLDKGANRPLYILSESMPPQHESLTAIALKSGYEKVKEDDFIVAYKSIQN